MKTGKTLQELAAELTRQQEVKRDFVVSTKNMEMDETASSMRLHRNGSDIDFGMTDLFHRQVGTKLAIPAKYYDKMRTEFPALLSQNVNGWLGKNNGRNMVRTMDGVARAFLSDRYRRIDNFDIATAALPIIGEMKGATIESCEITENRMYIKVINERLTMEVKKGDIVQAGFMLTNSEVGLGSVAVLPFTKRLVCLNGMVIEDLGKRRYHIGREHEQEAFELYSDITLKADDRAFMLKLQDILRTAVDEAKFAKVVDKMREAQGMAITGFIPDVVELTATKFGFNQNEKNDILSHLITGGDLSLFGLSQAVTRTAADVESYDRATELEGAGWAITNISPKTWAQLNEAKVV
jgi:hypothetical protein